MDTVRQNIRALMGERSINELAEAAGIGQTWLQRFMNPDKPSGIQKPNPDKLAPVARALGVSLNDLMFADLSGAARPTQSQAGRPDFGKMADAVYMLRQYLEIVGEPPEWVADPVMLEVAYAAVEAFGQPVTPSNVIDLTKRFANQVRNAGGRQGGREEVAGDGTDSGATRRRTA